MHDKNLGNMKDKNGMNNMEYPVDIACAMK